ncbi:retinol dehydrogenase 11-like isoform X2 [Cylas formicarius]|uniref:retinol dehydrogenase 11-like isoform X2 n=1 Tax=Cylas formicarius TaxID=197179 RepID=UPI00295853C8|nr:retinol dehydrogenase 11-like isoform X2 [Cylas formicarius]
MLSYLFSVLGVVIVFLSVKLFFKLTTGWCRSPVCLVGKVAIVTGANTGIGYETALDFAKRGAKVILACRNETKAKNATERIIRESDNPNVFYELVDFESLNSVRDFAAEIIRTQPKLNILVNNAGAGVLGDRLTEDELQITMQVNYFAPFLLTMMLLDLLKETPGSRIINVSSLAAIFGYVSLDNLNSFSGGEYHMYAKSKLCNILFTQELASRLGNTDVTTYSLHPGSVSTELFRNMPVYFKLPVEYVYMSLFRKTPLEGAQTTIHCAVQKGIEDQSGQHFHNCRRWAKYLNARNPDLAKKLWKKTEEMVKLDTSILLMRAVIDKTVENGVVRSQS